MIVDMPEGQQSTLLGAYFRRRGTHTIAIRLHSGSDTGYAGVGYEPLPRQKKQAGRSAVPKYGASRIVSAQRCGVGQSHRLGAAVWKRSGQVRAQSSGGIKPCLVARLIAEAVLLTPSLLSSRAR